MTIQYFIHYKFKELGLPVLANSSPFKDTMKIEKDKFNSLSEKDQNLQLLKVSMNVLISVHLQILLK